MKIRTLFVGTSEFAVPILKKILESDLLDLVGVVTQPDRVSGRHHSKMEASPVKNFLTENFSHISIFQPEKIKLEYEKILEETKPELILVASYGQILPKGFIEFPKYKSLNFHGSLLPKLRGAVPIPMAILKGLDITGVTLQIMSLKMDEGAIVSKEKVILDKDETTETLTEKLAFVSSEMIESVLPKWINGEIIPKEQDHAKATYCYKEDIIKPKAEINWSESAIEIDRKVRAFNPWPVAWSLLRSQGKKSDLGLEANEDFVGKRFLIYKIKILNSTFPSFKGGKLFKKGKSLIARVGKGWIEILEAKLEGKQKSVGSNYLYLANDTSDKVRAFIINKNRILLIKRKKKGVAGEYYTLPGGSVGVNESFATALKREIKEETGLDIEVGKQATEPETEDEITTNHFYEAVPLKPDQKLEIQGEENLYDRNINSYEPVWIDLADLNKIKTYGSIKAYIQKNK